VVSLRQLERQLEREKEKTNTELTAAHAAHEAEVDKLTKQLQSLTSDNNLLMVCCLELGTTTLEVGPNKLMFFKELYLSFCFGSL